VSTVIILENMLYSHELISQEAFNPLPNCRGSPLPVYAHALKLRKVSGRYVELIGNS
jgi:hypothetical protein